MTATKRGVSIIRHMLPMGSFAELVPALALESEYANQVIWERELIDIKSIPISEKQIEWCKWMARLRERCSGYYPDDLGVGEQLLGIKP